MSTYSRLTEVFKSAQEISFNNSSKIVIISDCHRGNNGNSDNFAKNQNLLFNAINYYYDNGFTYIELGDGDDLWKYKDFSEVRYAHSHIFWILQKLYIEGRFYMIWGNHDMVKKYPNFVKDNLYTYYDELEKKNKPLFDGIQPYEGLILKHQETEKGIFLVHGHQGDLINDALWRLGRFLVRYFWRPLEGLGINDPTSPAKNYTKKDKLEKKISEWVDDNKQMLIAGHTHRPMFPDKGTSQYFNDGSCVHPRCITGIEIEKGHISLIKWSVSTKKDGTLYVARDILAGPQKLEVYLGKPKKPLTAVI